MYNKKVKVYKILIVLLVMIMAGIGIINIGTKDKQVSVTNPSITGTNYGVYCKWKNKLL